MDIILYLSLLVVTIYGYLAWKEIKVIQEDCAADAFLRYDEACLKLAARLMNKLDESKPAILFGIAGKSWLVVDLTHPQSSEYEFSVKQIMSVTGLPSPLSTMSLEDRHAQNSNPTR